jgi:hypothetical protein
LKNDKNVKFIRKNGRVIPVKSKKSDGRKDKSTQVKSLVKPKNRKKVAIGGAVAGGLLGFKKGGAFGALIGANAGLLFGAGLSGVKHAKKKKGETKEELAKRIGSSV